MKKVLISKAIHEAGMKVLQGLAEPVVATDSTVETIKQLSADVEGIILRTNVHLSAEIMDAAPKLKIISRTGVGVNNVDVDAATERGIKVCNTPGVNAISVAEQALALILTLAKQIKPMNAALREGNWKIRNTYKAVDLDSKVLGLVGLGRIGGLVAEKCRLALNMKVIAYDPFVTQAENVELCDSLAEVFSAADVISVHVPYVQETHHLVSAELIALMKPTSFLINTARGAVVDEQALIAALQSGAIAGAGLDVFEQEPPEPDNPLPAMDSVVATPHSAALSAECVARVAAAAAQAIVDEFIGKQPKFVYNAKQLNLDS